jgi:hypothetical protein
MQAAFKVAMLKLSVLGHNIEDIADCSKVIPVPKTPTMATTVPVGLGHTDVEQACATARSPLFLLTVVGLPMWLLSLHHKCDDMFDVVVVGLLCVARSVHMDDSIAQ